MKKNILFLTLLIFLCFIKLDNASAKENTNITFTGKMAIESMEKLKEVDATLYEDYLKYKTIVHERCSARFGEGNYYYIIEKNASNINEINFIYGGSYSSTKRLNSFCYKKGTNEIEPYIYAFQQNDQANAQIFLYKSSNDYAFYHLGFTLDSDFNLTKEMNGGFITDMQDGRNVTAYIDSNISFKYKYHIDDDPGIIKYANSFTVNGVTYKDGDVIIENSSIVEPIKKPSLKYKEVHHTLNDDKTYKTKTMDFSFDIFDTSKYKYYFSKDNVMFFDFKENQVRITFNENTIIYFKVTDLSNNTVVTYFYEVKDINKRKYLDESLDITGKEIPSLGDNSYDDVLDEESESINGYIERFKRFFMDKFIIIEQFQNIYKKWSSYDPYFSPDREVVVTVRCPEIGDVVYPVGGGPQWCDIVWASEYKNKIPRLKIDLSFLKINKEFEVVDMGVLLKHRNDYFKWIYLSLGSYTAIKVIDRVIRIVRGFKQSN